MVLSSQLKVGVRSVRLAKVHIHAVVHRARLNAHTLHIGRFAHERQYLVANVVVTHLHAAKDLAFPCLVATAAALLTHYLLINR